MSRLGARARRSERGQGLTEYIIVVALVAVAAIGILSIFGQNVRAVFAAAAGVLGGDTNAAVGNYGSSGTGVGAEKRTLSDFGDTSKK